MKKMSCLETKHPRMWVEMDSNHRRRKPADLQSAPFGHSGIHPKMLFSIEAEQNYFINLISPRNSINL